jgi:hypothetical protein
MSTPEMVIASAGWWREFLGRFYGWTAEHTDAWILANGLIGEDGLVLMHVKGRDALTAALAKEPRHGQP